VGEGSENEGGLDSAFTVGKVDQNTGGRKDEASGRSKGEQGFNRKIGQRLRELRVLNGLTQTELGQKVGVSYQQVQKYERGRTI